MKRILVLFLIFLINACSPEAEKSDKSENVFTADADTVWCQYGPSWSPKPISLSQASNDTTVLAIYYEYQYDGTPQDWLIFAEKDTLTIGYSETPITVSLQNRTDKRMVKIYYISEEKPAEFSDDYVESFGGKAAFEIPEVFELANIAIAITDYGLENPWRVMKKNDYYQRVLNHFMPYKEHPLIKNIEFSDNRISDYYSFRDNSICYFFEGDSIERTGVHTFVRIPDLFGNHLALVRDFAIQSGFRQFYKDNAEYYREQIEQFQENVRMSQMWEWLEDRFPYNYDGYKVIFSPLINASHETSRFIDRKRDYSETIMFVGGPQLFADRYQDNLHAAMLARMIFTEIDHNYVNPVTRQYLDEIDSVFRPTDLWQVGSGYNSTWAFFNEYLTWALFVLYAREHYPNDDFTAIKDETIKTMLNRGFPRFSEFTNFVLQEYGAQTDSAQITDLYPRILHWAKSSDSGK